MSRLTEIMKSLKLQDAIHGKSADTKMIRMLLKHTTCGYTFQNVTIVKHVKLENGLYRCEYYLKPWFKPMIEDFKNNC